MMEREAGKVYRVISGMVEGSGGVYREMSRSTRAEKHYISQNTYIGIPGAS